MPNEQKTSNRPDDTDFKQQRLPSWQPILTPLRIIIIFLVVGIVFLSVGFPLKSMSDALKESHIIYDGPNADSSTSDCWITIGQNKTCQVTFTFSDDWEGPVYVYYTLDNYYQNHRRYVQSRSHKQLYGEAISASEAEEACKPLDQYQGQQRNPCGLIAGSYFNDQFTLLQTAQGINKELDETLISWESDRKEKFKQPDGFTSMSLSTPQSTAYCQGSSGLNDANAGYYEADGNYWCYLYPNDDTTYYLYEMYNNTISPIDGVTDEHFIVWMRTAALPNFRKIYGQIDADFQKGNQITFQIDARFEVDSYDASKGLMLSTVGEFGGKNPSLGIAYITVGSLSFFLALAFFIKHVISPRDTGAHEDLKWE